jgi:hypothetical protein
MKKIIFAILMLFAFATTAEARNQYSDEQPSVIDEILGAFGSGWQTVPQTNIRYRLRNGRQINRIYHHEDVYSSAPTSLVAYGRMLQHSGYRISEHPAFGGVHHGHHGWAHYAGRAIDVNIGAGNKEAYNPVMRSRMDQLAATARASGYTVLWRVAGHYDHIHIQM